MKKYLNALMGRVYRESATESSGGSIADATAAFSSFLGGEAPAENGNAEEDPEAAAERLAAEEAGATQNNAEDGEQQEQDGQDVAADTVTFEVDGKPVTMTKAELAELHKGGLRQQDYTKKTMEAAEQRKAADAEIQKTRADRESYAQQLHAFSLTQESLIAEAGNVLTQELLNNDPVEYLSQQRILQERQANLAKAQQEMQRIHGEWQQDQQKANQDFLVAQHQALLDKLPDWKDPVKMKAGMTQLETFMEDRGFNQHDGKIVLDARILLMANDAMKYRDLMARAAKAGAKVAAVPPKVERPGVAATAKNDGRSDAMKNLKKSGSLDDAAAAFLQMMR